MVVEAMWCGCGGYVVWLRRQCGAVAEAMWWVAGLSENKANSAKLELELGLSLTINDKVL